MKHGVLGATAAICVHCADDELTVEVIDENLDPERPVVPPPATGGGGPAGHGLAGMRARVVMLGGDLVAGPRDRGFGVRARLPLPVKIS